MRTLMEMRISFADVHACIIPMQVVASILTYARKTAVQVQQHAACAFTSRVHRCPYHTTGVDITALVKQACYCYSLVRLPKL